MPGKPGMKRRTKVEVLKSKEEALQKEKLIAEIKKPETPISDVPVIIEETGGITPLPLIGGEKKEEKPLESQMGSGIDDKILKEGLTEIVSEDIPRFLGNGIVIFNLEGRVSINPPSKGRAALWAEFALPWLRKNFPNFDADLFFYVMSFSMFASMVEIKKGSKQVIKKEEKENASGTTSNSGV